MADRYITGMVNGVKTVSTTAASLFAGASTRLAERYNMTVYNDSVNTIYFGGSSSVTTTTGFPVLPGDYMSFSFNPNISLSIYFVAAADSSVRVLEIF